ncbi:MAG: LptA/OstA family protein, partial [Planctomycetota bacterium]|nr:LptA/OstA family protein [Planctomycetota bacterium]
LVPAQDKTPPAVVCLGRGNLRHFNEQGVLELEARWSEHLHRVRAENGLDLIRLTGLAEVEQPPQSFRLDADGLDLWLDPKDGAATAKPASTSIAASGRMQPVRLIAEATQTPNSRGLVMLRSPELAADAKTLNVTFVDPPAPQAPETASRSALQPTGGQIRLASAEHQNSPPSAPPPEPRTLEVPVTARALPNPATAEPAPAKASSAAVPEQPPAPPEPIELVAEIINVTVERQNDEQATADKDASADRSEANRGGQIREVHTTGGVLVRQKRSGSDEPLTIHGDRLDLFSRGKDQELIHIHGKPASVAADGSESEASPAQVHDGGADLYGMNINLDRKENRAWVEGRGVLLLPAKGVSGSLGLADDADLPKTEAAGEPAEPERLQVWWMERMDFEGDKAVFFGDVQTKMQNDVMSCQEMEVRLTERFDFAAAGGGDSAKPSTRPEVAEVICKTGVGVDGQEFEGDKLVSIRRAQFFEFHLDQRTGATHALGPGHIEMWKVGDGNRASLTADNAVRANASRQPVGDAWEYLFVRFNGTSDGNIKQRTTTFHDRVRIVYGPVADKTQTIDPDRVDRGPAEGGWMKCGQLTLTQHSKTETAAAYSEVLGEGNVQIDGRGFSGVADQVTYDESKGQYILKSFGRRAATIAKKNSDGRASGDASAQEIKFYPARMYWQVVNGTEFNGAQ